MYSMLGTVCKYQSINQSNFYSTNIPGEARLSGATNIATKPVKP